MSVHYVCTEPVEARESIKSPGTGVADGCELLVLGIEPRSSGRAASTFSH